VCRHVQPFIFVLQDFAYRASFNTELGSDIFLPGGGQVLMVYTNRFAIDITEALLPLLAFSGT
jgi:hypothetical protein